MIKLKTANTGKRLRAKAAISHMLRYEFIYITALLCIVISVIFYEHKLLNSQLLINHIVNQTAIDYEEFRKLQINEQAIDRVKADIKQILKANPQYKGVIYMDPVGYLTMSMMAGDYNLLTNNPVDRMTFLRGLAQISAESSFRELYLYYRAIFSDAVYFPVARMDNADISYSNSWYYTRTYGGLRKHEGCDIMADNNLRGYFPVVSITDGIVEKMGWLEQGGYRIGIRAAAGAYFYYAHLEKYAEDIAIGDRIVAGQLLGYMGDSGYGSEGTVGKFAVHLHMGLYVDCDSDPVDEMSVNPYYLLRLLENNRIYPKKQK